MLSTSAWSEEEEITWALDVEYGRPQQMLMVLPLESEKPYWYLLYDVTNNTTRDRYLFLRIWLVVDGDEENRTYPDRLIPVLESKVEKTFEREFSNRVGLVGTPKEGETRKCIALFGPIGYKIKDVMVYVDGLTKNTLHKDEDGRPYFHFRRARVLYERQGKPEDEPYTVLLKRRQDFASETLQVPDEAIKKDAPDDATLE
ncbi:MAG: hypothetical protein O2857_30115 [Planctomycetota bacterium]|nr:hypothetical protein [Planctomycetota bacterium]